jgi:hypothetical protein
MKLALTYDLAFTVGQRRPYTPPEIIFIVEESRLPEVVTRLQQVIERQASDISDYLEIDTSVFSFPFPDLLGKRSLGYRSCGYVTIEAGKAYFRLPLRPYPWTYRTSLTISLLAKALQIPFGEYREGERKQDVILMVMCEKSRTAGGGHSTGGWVSQRVLRWLKAYATKVAPGYGRGYDVPMHPLVIQAQQATWHAINTSDMQKYGSPQEIRSRVYDDGSFFLKCSGNACDLGVYPCDYSDRNDSELISFGSHNLDTAQQQLTLLAGLAKICELARSS